ncbi:uncharacterized protein [Bemisia tabaci]|uniref:uncharacterized protein n=1 Tax=Bemisia tabaci TaxID=7038 RepID=UPI003B2896B4
MEDTGTLRLQTYICSPSYTCRPTFPEDEVSDVYRETSPPRADPEAGHAVFLKQEPCLLDQFNEELSSHPADSSSSLQGHEDGLHLPGNSCSQGQIQTNVPIALISQIKEEVNDEDNLFNLSNSSDRIGNESVEAERICQEAILPEGTVHNSGGFRHVSKEEVPDEVEEIGHTVSKSCVVVLCKLPSGFKRNSFVVESEYGVWDFVDRVGNRINRFDSFSPESRRAIHGRVRNQFGNVETFSINIWDPALRKYNTLFDRRRTLPPSRNLENNTGKYCPSSAFNCNLCEATFGSGVHLKVHMRRRHTGKKSFTCSYCPASFSVKVNWQYHERTHRENRRIFVCKRCKVSYCQAGHLMKHMFTHHGEKPFKCGRCSATFADNDHLLGHIRTTHTEESQVCGKESQVSISAEVDLTNPMRTLISDELFNCNFCAAAFENEANLRSHMLSKHIGKKPQNRRTFVCTRCNMTFCNYDGYKPFTCSYCPASFFEKITREHHERTHRENKRIFVCKRCKMTFCLSAQLIKHTVTHHSEQKFKCSYCSATFEHSGHLERHMTTHTGERQVCGRESQKSISAANLANPMRTLNSYKPLNCNLCAAAFENEANLRSHMRERHPGKQLFTCRYCPASFNLKHCWKKHLRTHRENKRIFICKECKMSFCRPAHLEKHMLTHRGGKPYKCNHCAASFANNGLLGRHMMTHTVEKQVFVSESQNSVVTEANSLDHASMLNSDEPFKGNLCEANFGKKFNLKRRVRSRTRLKSVKCNLCAAAFENEANLRSHMCKRHPGKPLFTCRYCPASFNWKHCWKEHLRTHRENKRIFICKECKMSFCRPAHLKKHMLTHCGGKPFKCNHCGAAFEDNGLLGRHMMTHTGEKQDFGSDSQNSVSTAVNSVDRVSAPKSDKPFKCNVCKANFASKFNLERHVGVHTNEISFTCNLCGDVFGSERYLNAHMSRWHTGFKPHTEEEQASGSESENSVSTEVSSVNPVRTLNNDQCLNCKFCGADFKRRCDFDIHIHKHTREKSFACSYCPASFFNNARFISHERSHRENRQSFICKWCKMSFHYSVRLVKHTLAHHSEQKFECSYCSASFAYNGHLERHIMTTHTEKKLRRGSETLKSLREEAHSTSHTRSHDEKYFNSSDCRNSSSRKSGLEAPLQTQWQTANETKFEKRGVYACDLCPMTYCYPSYLVDHMRTHLGERAHKGSHCPAAFASNSDLERHVMTHQKEEQFACSKTRESSFGGAQSTSHSEIRQSASHSGIRQSASQNEIRESSLEGAQSAGHSEIRQSASHSEIRQSASYHEIRQSAGQNEIRESSFEGAQSTCHSEIQESSFEVAQSTSHSEIRQSASHSEIRQSASHCEIRQSASHSEIRQSASHSEIRQLASHSEIRLLASQNEVRESSFEGAQSTSHSEIRESSFEGTQSASHMRTQKDGNLLKCWYCPATFSRPKFRSRHIASHNFDKKPFPTGCSSPSSARTKQLSTHPSPREERFSCEGTPVKPL